MPGVLGVTTPPTYFSPAVTAGTPERRTFATAFPGYPYPWRTLLNIQNRTTSLMTVVVNGYTFKIPAGTPQRIKAEEVGRIHTYTVDFAATQTADTYMIEESGGMSNLAD